MIGSQDPGGKDVKKKTSSAQLHAEKLFEAKPIADIREIEKRTRSDIDVKKKQLRQLVGGSYKDLIDNADRIVAISNLCGQIISNVKDVQGGFASLARSFASSETLLLEKRDSFTKHEALNAVGSRVKYLIDTPEIIWGALDSSNYMEAARRLLRAHKVHALLSKSFSKEDLSRFPLLDHHWPLVEKFRKQILDSVHSVLASKAALNSEAAVDALAAACALDGLTSQTALDLLLKLRTTYISQQLEAAAVPVVGKTSSDQKGSLFQTTEQLSNLAVSIQMTIHQVGELFLLPVGTQAPAVTGIPGPSGSPAICTLQVATMEESEASELMFSGHGTLHGVAAAPKSQAAGAAAGGIAAEAVAWKEACHLITGGLAALTPGQVEKACMAWVHDTAASFLSNAGPLLSVCTSAAMLSEAESALHQAIRKWQPVSEGRYSTALNTGLAITSNLGQGLISRPSVNTPAAALDVKGSATAGTAWDQVCVQVLGFPLNLWQEIFQAPFLVQCKSIIQQDFRTIAQGFIHPLKSYLEAAGNADPVSPGQLPATSWPQNAPGLSAGAARESLDLNALTRTWSERASGLKNTASVMVEKREATGFRNCVHHMLRDLDMDLLNLLNSVLMLQSGPVETSVNNSSSLTLARPPLKVLQRAPSLATTSSTGGVAGDAAAAAAARAAELEVFVQDKCSDMSASIAAHLKEQLHHFQVLPEGAAGAAGAEQVLLLGRLCSGLASDSKYLPVLLGAPELWRATAAAAVTAGGGSLQGAAAAGRLRHTMGRQGLSSQRSQQAIEAFSALSLSAFRCWAVWSGASLAKQLGSYVEHDDLLSISSTPQSWQEVVVSMTGQQGSGTDGASALLISSTSEAPAADMRFHLPACPSPSAMALLEAACQEVRRAGDHTAGVEALQVLEWELSEAVLRTINEYLDRGSDLAHVPRLSEKGVLQLLFDVRTIRDVLAGARPHGTSSSATAASDTRTSSLIPTAVPDPVMAAAMADRKRAWQRLEQQLQDRLDPIDWATYEPYFWGHVQKYASRVSVLFGTLTQLHRSVGQEGTSRQSQHQQLGAASDTNALNVLPVAPRFQYLPISAPTAVGLTGSALSSISLSPSLGGPVGRHGMRGVLPGNANVSGTSLCSDLAGSFSFADLGMAGKAGEFVSGSTEGDVGSKSGGSIGEAASASMAAGASALSAFQARLQAGLGTMLGDKAAEMTAIAQQRLDNIADFTALGSGLLNSSGLFKAAPRK
ncbi:hypothetical protein CEUSTIGMA_g1682.t1 [Chlamydomonas eustigma]|uniref:Conserved oligomeric Golgi complex subunit 1 n=1 Tax=Chlamydomonas eustigma TaxID=1157962 RepID=A0A250WTT2_9CHLO|nr:hypothetical protein CEUSTIGMA_g1682.t1 [Chlamydomonas eustigma]|eukprot:GAX74233.1 hypothetical protein CEUSTIGMA_g1682.t1 [Chlamydomonas eustigma]